MPIQSRNLYTKARLQLPELATHRILGSRWETDSSQTMDSHPPSKSPASHGQGRSRRRRMRASASATSSCAGAAACAAAGVVLLSLAGPAHGFGVFPGSTVTGTDGAGSSSGPAAARQSYRGAGAGRRGGMAMRSTLSPPPPSTTSTETIDGGTQTVREMSAQMSQVSFLQAASRGAGRALAFA